MTVVLVTLLVALFSLVVFALYEMGFLQDPLKKKTKDKEDKDMQDEESEKFNRQLNSLRKEMERLRVEHAAATKEAERAQKKEMELQGQLIKQKEWSQADKDKFERATAQSTEIKNELIKKEKELKEEFSKNKYSGTTMQSC